MELTKKQIILIAVISGAVLLLTAAVLIFMPGDEAAVPEPAPTPLETDVPDFTPVPVSTPIPTAFRLPLVPQRDTPSPTADTTGAFVPQPAESTAEPLGDGAGPWAGVCDEHTKDILAVGLQNGRAAALLLLRLCGDVLTITALPADEVPLSGESIRIQGERAASLAEERLGRSCGGWLALDLGRLPAILQITGPLGEPGEGVSSPKGALALTADAVAYVQRTSLLKLPALKRAVGEGFASNLSSRELWSLFWTVRGGVTVRGLLLATATADQKIF